MVKERSREVLIRDAAILYDQIKLCSEGFEEGKGVFDLSTYPQRLLLARLEGMSDGIAHALGVGGEVVEGVVSSIINGTTKRAIDVPILKGRYSKTGLVYLNDPLEYFKRRYPGDK